MSKQLDLFGSPKLVLMCGECDRIYRVQISADKFVWKCNHKVRGMGYDIKKSQEGCINFRFAQPRQCLECFKMITKHQFDFCRKRCKECQTK